MAQVYEAMGLYGIDLRDKIGATDVAPVTVGGAIGT
jgi:hypothetical protein